MTAAVKIAWLDHVNIRTADLAAMSAFYADMLGLPRGERPPVPFGGAWHYCAGRAVVHLVEMARPLAGQEPRLEHFALRAEAGGLERFIARIKAARVKYNVTEVPGAGITQVNVYDPDGNHIEVQFAAG
jgi:catechol 2,3-dioxygenase-like lactoylglutathione lyase family enzyme